MHRLTVPRRSRQPTEATAAPAGRGMPSSFVGLNSTMMPSAARSRGYRHGMTLGALAFVIFIGIAACAAAASAHPLALPRSCDLEPSPVLDADITKLVDAYTSHYDMGTLKPEPAVLTHVGRLTDRTCSCDNGFSLTVVTPATTRNYDMLLSQFSYEYPELLKGIGTYAFALAVTNTETTFTNGKHTVNKNTIKTYDIDFLILASGNAGSGVRVPVLVEISQDKGTLAGERKFAEDLVALVK